MDREGHSASGGPIALAVEIHKKLRAKIWITEKVETGKICAS
jgi:hypothetical protein